MKYPLIPILCSMTAAVFCLLVFRLLHIRRIHRRERDEIQKQLDITKGISKIRGNALDYIVRSRVVDYEYDYYGYEIDTGVTGIFLIRRTMIFSPPKNKDIICKLITLCEHSLAPQSMSLQDCDFSATVYAPDRDPVEYTLEDTMDDSPRIIGWDFESHPWLIDVTDEEGRRVKVIMLFIPMITDTRKLELNYTWPHFFPEFSEGKTTARAKFSLIKASRLLRVTIRNEKPSLMTLTLYPPNGSASITEQETGTDITVSMEEAPQGTYLYEIDIRKSTG